MRIAVTYKDGDVFQHFGHTDFFKIYDVEDGNILFTTVLATEGTGHGALAALLKQLRVDTLICGGIGGGAQKALNEVGIKFYAGVKGYANDAVNALIAGTLLYNPNPVCTHHGADHDCSGHSCGSHDCGSHKE